MELPYSLYVYGAGSWGSVTSVFFLLSGLFSDLLLVRWSLVLAYLFFCINIALAFPAWGNWGLSPNPVLCIGQLIFAIASMLTQVIALWRLLWDERPIHFSNEDEEQVWRCFNRRCGMARMEFNLLLKYARWRVYHADEIIYQEGRDVPHLNFIVEGMVELTVGKNCGFWGESGCGTVIPSFTKGSGQMFDLKLLSLFGIFSGFEHLSIKTAKAKTRVLVMTFSADALVEMASGACGPALPSYWRALALYNVSAELSSRAGQGLYCSKGDKEHPGWALGGRTSDMIEPLDDDEKAGVTTSLIGIIVWMYRSLDLMPPPGLRHHSSPARGALARNRILLEQEMMANGSLVPECLCESQKSIVGRISRSPTFFSTRQPSNLREALLLSIHDQKEPKSTAAEGSCCGGDSGNPLKDSSAKPGSCCGGSGKMQNNSNASPGGCCGGAKKGQD